MSHTTTTDPPRPPRRNAFPRIGVFGAVLVLTALVTLTGALWGLPNHWDVAADSIVPMGRLASRTRDMEKVTSYRYPPLHLGLTRLALNAPDAIGRLRFFRERPKLLSTLYILTARLLSVAMGVGTVALVFILTRRLFGRSEAVWAALVMALSPVTQYYAKNANLDIPYVFWLAVFLVCFERFLDSGRPWTLVLAGLAGTAAVCTKDQAYGFLALFPIPALLALRRRRGSWPKALSSRGLWSAGAASLLAFLLIHNILFAPGVFLEHARVIMGPASEGWRETARGPVGQVRLLLETLLLTASAMTTPVFLAGCLGASLALRRREGRWVLLGPLGYWLTFLAVIGYVYPRFTLPLMLGLAPFAGHGLTWLWRLNGRARLLGRTAAALAAAWLAVVALAFLHDLNQDTRVAAQHWIEAEIPETDQLAYLAPMRDMPRLNRPELDARRGHFEAGAFVPLPVPGRSPHGFTPRYLVLSLGKDDPARGAPSDGPAALALRALGTWGRVKPRSAGGSPYPKGRFRPVATFRPTFGRLWPRVASSAGRVILVLRRESSDATQRRPRSARSAARPPPP